jgi:hypothetical protein
MEQPKFASITTNVTFTMTYPGQYTGADDLEGFEKDEVYDLFIMFEARWDSDGEITSHPSARVKGDDGKEYSLENFRDCWRLFPPYEFSGEITWDNFIEALAGVAPDGFVEELRLMKATHQINESLKERNSFN